jgi:putative sigma-54 modulation protein
MNLSIATTINGSLRGAARDVKIPLQQLTRHGRGQIKTQGGVAMDVRFVTRNAEATDEQKDFMERKLSKVEKFFNKILDVQVVLDYKRGMNIVEITANANGLVMRGEDHSPDMRKAFDKALKNIERQVKRHKDYLNDRTHIKTRDISFDLPSDIFGDSRDQDDSSPTDIVKVKRFPVSVMLPTEAARQMDLLGHSFFLFRNGENGDFNVVYRRNDGGYGLLEPLE